MKAAVACLSLSIAFAVFAAAPSTIHNDDSCDIAALPAATLLLPWFEVDMTSPQGATTIFTVTNVTNLPQIARVTLWTDWSYPVFSFDLFLTGYDAQAISLFDVIAGGQIAPPYRTTSWEDEGVRSANNDDNPLLDVSKCAHPVVAIPRAILEDLRSALTTGIAGGCGTQRVGRTHQDRAIGYATIDVVKSCSTVMPADAGYFTREILYDNVLIGDYQLIDRGNNFAQGGTMVHVRAIPEGGTARNAPTLPVTFYSRHQGGGTEDRRQPLPSLFAMRWIEGGPGALNTAFKIWRDRDVDAAGCRVAANGAHPSADVVRFDEDENPTVHAFDCSPLCPSPYFTLPGTSRIAASDLDHFPPNPAHDPGGWIYINLNDYETRPVASQSWVTVEMSAEGRYTTEVGATALGNGCTPEAAAWTDLDGAGPSIGPAPDDNGAKPPALEATIDNDDSCDITQAPAATLLLPFFEVDLDGFGSVENTLFTVTNVSPLPQIAHVTIWTDSAYPILTFDIFLTGYDVQSVSLFDVLALGRFARPSDASELEPGRRSAGNDANPIVDATTCSALPAAMSAPVLAEVQRALTTGLIQACGKERIGETHEDAIGYVTIDVVRDCSTTLPTDPRYYSDHISYDNVLTGDYLQIDPANNFAQGGAMVHVRAIPEGGRGNEATRLDRTFYSRYQSGRTGDRRQPLPSTFAARWIEGGTGSFNTTLKVWRETATGSKTGCAVGSRPGEWPLANAAEFVRFDEDENPTTFTYDEIITVPPPTHPRLPAASRISASDRNQFPPNPDGAIAGWFYLNLDLGTPIDTSDPDVASQNWVVVSMRAEGRFSTDFDALALGNGCSPVVPITGEDGSDPVIGPAENRNPIRPLPSVTDRVPSR